MPHQSDVVEQGRTATVAFAHLLALSMNAARLEESLEAGSIAHAHLSVLFTLKLELELVEFRNSGFGLTTQPPLTTIGKKIVTTTIKYRSNF